MRALVVIFASCALAWALPCAGEDRTERIEGAKGWKELDFRGSLLVEERSFDVDGVLLEERSFSPEALPIVTKRYIRDAGRLLRIEASDASGAPIGSMSYHYDSYGRLLVAKAQGIFGEEAVGLIAVAGSPKGSWIESADATAILAYDEEGRAVLLQNMKEGKTTAIERRTYSEEGRLKTVEIEDKAQGSLATIIYDDSGKEKERKLVGPKGEETLTKLLYDDFGRLAEELSRRGGYELSQRRLYSKEGVLTRAETRRNGALILVVEYFAESRVEGFYEDGKLFVRATYAGGRKTRDEFFVDGVLKRAREYQ